MNELELDGGGVTRRFRREYKLADVSRFIRIIDEHRENRSLLNLESEAIVGVSPAAFLYVDACAEQRFSQRTILGVGDLGCFCVIPAL